jgi:predicted nuclease of predicted toxin-antitoxin system
MKIKVDEDLPWKVAALLREKSYQADSVVEQGMSGWKDAELWAKIQTESRFLITADKGFANILAYPPGKHAGVMLLRPDQDGIRPTVELIERVLQSYDLNALASTTTVVTPRSIRVRRATRWDQG